MCVFQMRLRVRYLDQNHLLNLICKYDFSGAASNMEQTIYFTKNIVIDEIIQETTPPENTEVQITVNDSEMG